MQPFPHHYPASGMAFQEGTVRVSSPGVDEIPTAAPVEFGGPGDLWSPEGLFVASVADCFILTFRAIARASKFDWQELRCDVVGVLNKVGGVTQFAEFQIKVALDVADGADVEKANRLLHRAEQGCLITNSLTATTSLTVDIRQSEAVLA